MTDAWKYGRWPGSIGRHFVMPRAWKLHRECPNDMDETEHPTAIKHIASLRKVGAK